MPHRALSDWLTEEIRSLPAADISGGPLDPVHHAVPTVPLESSSRAWKHLVRSVITLVFIVFSTVGVVYTRSILLSSLAKPDAERSGSHVGTDNLALLRLQGGSTIALRIEQLSSDIKLGGEDLTALEPLKARLHELELGREKALTKVELRQLEDLRRELAGKQDAIKFALNRKRQDISSYFTGIEQDLPDAKEPAEFESLLTRIDQSPHPEAVDEVVRLSLDGLRQKIIFAKKFRELEAAGDFRGAAAHLTAWSAGNQRELGELRQVLKQSIEDSLEKILERGIDEKKFGSTRKTVHAMSSAPEIDKIVDKELFAEANMRLDKCQDKYLYCKIRDSHSPRDEEAAISDYLGSPVVTKCKENVVSELNSYLQEANQERVFEFEISSIYWGDCWTGNSSVALTIQPKGKSAVTIKPVQVTATKDSELGLDETPIKISYMAKPTDCVTLRLEIKQDKLYDNGSFKFYGTTDALNKQSSRKLNLKTSSIHIFRRPNRNQFQFILRGLPKKPSLPPWKD